MKAKAIALFCLTIVAVQTSLSQAWLDTVRTIYSSSSRLHNTAIWKPISRSSYWWNSTQYIAVVEDSGASALIKSARFDYKGNVIQPFTTLFTRSNVIGTMQYLGMGDNPDSLEHQYLFWEEKDTTGWHIMFSHRPRTGPWDTASRFSPSSFPQLGLICTQANQWSYPSLFTFLAGWLENDSLTIVKMSPDSLYYRTRIAAHSSNDTIHSALSDKIIIWETHDPLSGLRYASWDDTGSITSTDTIPDSRNASYPAFLFSFWDGSDFLAFSDSNNGIGNIASEWHSISPSSWGSKSPITQDSSGINIPIGLFRSPQVTKSSRPTYDYRFDYLVYTRTVTDSTAFVRLNNSLDNPAFTYWTKNPITDIDVKPGIYIPSAWIENTEGGFQLQLHIGEAIVVGVEQPDSKPTAFSLQQNFPNPFNPSTTIRYFLPATGRVTLNIFDILGRELTKLVDEKQSYGNHEVKWNADKFPSGLYFYRLTSNGHSMTNKMILIK